MPTGCTAQGIRDGSHSFLVGLAKHLRKLAVSRNAGLLNSCSESTRVLEAADAPFTEG